MNKYLENKSQQETLLRLKAIIDTAIDGIITIDEKGIVESINPAGAKLFGYEPAEVVGHNIKMLMPTPYREEHDGYLKNHRETGEKKIIGIGREVQGRRKDGVVFPFRLSVSTLQLPGKRMFTGIIHDLTKQKAAEEELKKLNKELEKRVTQRTEELNDTVNKLLKEVKDRKAAQTALQQSEEGLKLALIQEKELNELKSRFVSMASHEFRTPLSTILSSAALLGRYTKTEQQEKRDRHIKKIKSAVNNLTGILNDFLSLSKLEEGKIQHEPELIDINAFHQELIDEMSPLLKTNQTIQYEGLLINQPLNIDPRLLKNSMINLMSNAIKYSAEGTVVKIFVKLKNKELTISVVDQGIGIPEEDKQHMFSRFFRANNAVNIKGTGLGLTIVKRYLAIMGGDITFESEEGMGTTFMMMIPVGEG